MKNALILHGTLGSSNENWFPWLRRKLEKMNYKVWLPDLPRSDTPNLQRYNDFIFAKKDWEFSLESIIIGHSSGAVAVLGLLSELSDGIKIDTCILVSPFEKDSPGGKWEPNRELFDYEFDLEKVKNSAKKFVLFISDDDKYCPVDYVQRLAKTLGGEVVVTHGDGHFSVSSGGSNYRKLPILLTYLK